MAETYRRGLKWPFDTPFSSEVLGVGKGTVGGRRFVPVRPPGRPPWGRGRIPRAIGRGGRYGPETGARSRDNIFTDQVVESAPWQD
jgi:hypothetical protein